MSIPPQEQMTLLTDYDTNSPYSLAFQKLYANISFTWDQEQSKQHTLLLATPTPYIGQETIAANVAIVAAQSGMPTILVDANLHRPTLDQRFGVGKNVGLSDLLAQTASPSIAPTLCDTFVPNLRLLSTGTAPLQEISMLYSKRLQTIVEALRTFLNETEHEPGIVIFNGPAILTSAEASLISDKVDQTLLAIVAGRTTRRQAKQAQEQLQHAHGTLMGVVMLDI